MYAQIRAHRILSKLPNFERIQSDENCFISDRDIDLGVIIGVYHNTDLDGEDVHVFSDGIRWKTGNKLYNVKYREILSIDLENKKDSKALVLHLINGNNVYVPINGRRGNFFDVMEVLRFFERVLNDTRGA
ncbi:hypothetical protein [Niveispirillum sp. KHB5.9]|uniref:hypothetical protein n=1 Tax=Niveispirillum sp. KHB5.9 TaxID=3400269 RepID=UPI003A88F06F